MRKETAVADRPQPFGYKTAWFAVRSDDTKAVADTLGLGDLRPASWAQGIEGAYAAEVFASPPVAGWVLVAGSSIAEGIDGAEQAWRAQLASLSSRFGTAQLFCTHRVVEMHVWARAQDGVIQRAYGHVGESGTTLFNEGEQTAEERELDLSYPDEEMVMAIARRWSLAPIELTESSADPSLGLLGKLAGALHVSGGKKPWWRFW